MADYSRGNEGWARGHVLFQLRRKKHLTIEQAASRIGFSAKTLGGWEKNGTMKWENANAVARFYKVPADSIFTIEEPEGGDGEDAAAASVAIDLERLEAKMDQALQVTASVAEDLQRLARLVEELAQQLPGPAQPPT